MGRATLWTIGVAGLVVAGLAMRPAAAAEPVNLVTNGGFEDGLSGWTPDAKHELADGADEAHSGSKCLTGEATAPRQALFVNQKIRVRAGNRYQFEIWARATNRTKLVLWAVQPGTSQRQLVTAWENVPAKWRRYSAPLPVHGDGTLELQIIAPSSHNAPPGKIWVDDVAVWETDMPPITSVSGGEGFNDEPAMAAAGDGSVYVAWTSFREGADSLQVARYRVTPKGFDEIARWPIVGGQGTYVMGPEVVAAGEDVAVVYAAETNGNWDVYAVPCLPKGPGEPVRVTTAESVDVDPTASWHEETLWVAWESNAGGSRQILASAVRGGQPSEPVSVSTPGGSCYDPSLVTLESGEVAVAWHSFRENNYDIYLRRSPAGKSWGDETRLTKAPTIDRHAALFARGDELWLAYENALVTTYHVGATNQRRLIVAKVTAEGLVAPVHPGRSPLEARCEAASPTFDATGRLWMAYLQPRLPRSGWDVWVTCHSGEKWQPPVPVSNQKGMDRRPAVAVVGDRAVVAVQNDDMPRSWGDVDLTPDAVSNIFLASVPLDSAPDGGPVATEPLVEPDDPFEAAEIRVARGEDLPTPSIEYQGEKLNLYFGDLHEHTDISVCNRVGDQAVDESYQHMRDLARYDFACATDHGYNINPYLWGFLAKQARANDDPGRFLTFLAEEWTSTFEEYSTEHPFGFYGHRNLIFADPYFPRWWNARNRQTPAQVWEDLRKMNADFIHIPHQLADTGNVPTDWNFADEEAQPVAEIFQTRGSYEYKGTPREAKRSTPGPGYFLQDAWARGIVIGVIAAPDHGGGYGKACVWAPELKRETVLEAIRQRHCYGTTAAKIVLDVRVDGHLMGEKLPEAPGRLVEVQIRARCPGEIDRVEVCRNNRFIYTNSPEGAEAELTFVDREPLEGNSYYYVRVIQKDEEIAWSSPVWFAP